MIRKISIPMTLFFLFWGCTGKQLVNEKNQESALITFRTSQIQYSDMGFIYKGDNFVKVEIYSMGQPIMNLDINALNICMSLFQCMEKQDFNTKVLHANYPKSMLENIFKAEPIFGGENLTQNSNGFTQKIKKEGLYDITYSVISYERIFRDTINKILIKVKPQ